MKYKKLAKALEAMPDPVKNKEAYKYKYADLSQVKSIVDPALREQGLIEIQYQTDGTLYTKIIDTETGEELISDSRAVLTEGNEQERGSSETYQRRYALLTVCGLAPDDDDGAAASKKGAPKQKGSRGAPNNARNTAVIRLNKAIEAYCNASGEEVEKMKQGVKDRDNYADSAKFYTAVAEEFESML